MLIEDFELAQLKELDQMLDCLKSRSHDFFVFFSGTCPDRVNQVILQRVLFIDSSRIGQLQRTLDQLSVRVLLVDILQYLSLHDPAGEVLEI